MAFNKNYTDLLIDHYCSIWTNDYKVKQYDLGPMKALSKDFCIIEYPPNVNREMWVYTTCGMPSNDDDTFIELHIFSPKQSYKIVEILTAVSYYHKSEKRLNLNHTVNFGVPWQFGSKCSYGLISLPYLYGSKLELLQINEYKTVHCYWLLPITIEEVNYKKANSIESLEEKFQERELDYLNPLRASVV